MVTKYYLTALACFPKFFDADAIFRPMAGIGKILANNDEIFHHCACRCLKLVLSTFNPRFEQIKEISSFFPSIYEFWMV